MMTLRFGSKVPLRRLLRICRLIFALPLLSAVAAAASGAETAPGPTPEHAVALKGLDAAMARFAALLEKDDDAAHKAAGMQLLADFNARRSAVREKFDQARYDELRWDLNVEYQRLVKWLAAPALKPPLAKASKSDGK